MSAPRRPTSDRPAADIGRATEGAVALEYGLLVALVALAALVGIVSLGRSVVALPLQLLIDAFVAALS